jgi:hypothetical protein
MENRKIIGVWTITNNAALKLLSIEFGIEDEARLQFNDRCPFVKPIKYDEEGDAYIEFNGWKFYFHECLRVAA